MRKPALLLLCGMAMCACINRSENVVVKPLDNSWASGNALTFSYDIHDAQNPKNIIFVVRNNDDYPYSNLRLIADVVDAGSKKKTTDTLNYILAEPNGKWIGTGFGTTKENLFQYKLDYRFPKNGRYSIVVQQAMRQKNLKGIEDFGVKIEPAKP